MKQLVIKDIKLKYRRSFLGYIWSILNPLMIMIKGIVLCRKRNSKSGIQQAPLICSM